MKAAASQQRFTDDQLRLAARLYYIDDFFAVHFGAAEISQPSSFSVQTILFAASGRNPMLTSGVVVL